jgi:CRP-like cAMP-binding protein
MPDELFERLDLSATSVSAPEGTTLFRRDQPSQSVYLVRSGTDALLWPDAEETTPMEVIGPGSIIGLPAAINATYSVTAKIVVDSELGIISAARVLELLETVPGLCRTAMRMMSEEIARMRSSTDEHCTHIEH